MTLHASIFLIKLKKIFALSKIDPWFLEQIKEIVDWENKIYNKGLPKDFNEFNLIKSIGFSDKKLSELTDVYSHPYIIIYYFSFMIICLSKPS